jgi:MoxR-like ATPase
MERPVEPVLHTDDILQIQEKVKQVRVSDSLLHYTREIIELTRNTSDFVTGASPRAFLSLISAARGKAMLSGRDYVKPDDIKAVAGNVLHHRLTLSAEARIRGEKTDRLLAALILKARIPMEN